MRAFKDTTRQIEIHELTGEKGKWLGHKDRNFFLKNWHSKCLKCANCNELLKDKCFVKDSDVYCKEDFFR